MQPQSVVLPVVLVTLGMVFTQTGASLAKLLFPLVGEAGATTLRLTLAAIVLVAIFRPWRHRLSQQQWRDVLIYGGMIGLGVALLSSAIPYALDMAALPQMPSRLFGILMSAQPALGALSGFLILNETLAPWQLAGIGGVIVASIGTTVTIARNAPAKNTGEPV